MAACNAISAFLPSIISKSIFAPRRADKSLEADSAPVSILNAGIATMQLAKLGEGVSAIAQNSKNAANGITAAAKNVADSSSIFKDVINATNRITKHVSINGFIGLAALANTLASDDKESALIQNGSMYGGMLAFEGAHKLICGKSNSTPEKIDEVEGLYRKFECLRKPVDNFKSMCEKQAEAMSECGEVKRAVAKVIKHLPPILKGGSFAVASIGGSALCYNLGGLAAEKITGREVA